MPMSLSPDYKDFFRFIEKFASPGYAGIDPNDPLLLELENLTEHNNQFFYIGDILQMKFHFVSKRSRQMLGIEPDELSPYHFFEATHPDDLQRHTLARAKLFKMAHDLYTAEQGFTVFSTDIKLRNPQGGYSNLLFQLYLFYTTIPYKSVFLLKIHTNIDWFKKRKHGFHYYVGNDPSYFKYPDEELLMTGSPLSEREIEIVKLIETGLSSEQIADKLFLSVHTVNTHRRNILEKTGKAHISDVIYDFTARGIM
jgi:DNA-binding CsgD family transcriptional regulator